MSVAPQTVLVVAVGDNGVIGHEGGLPWRMASDMRHFRRTTMGKPMVMGRKTFQSIGRPLPGRTTIVVSRNPAFAAPGVVMASSLSRALEVARADARRRGAEAVAVVGGAGLYAEALALADEIVMTRVHLSPPGDTRMPALGPEWVEAARSAHERGPQDDAAFDVVRYRRSTPRDPAAPLCRERP